MFPAKFHAGFHSLPRVSQRFHARLQRVSTQLFRVCRRFDAERFSGFGFGFGPQSLLQRSRDLATLSGQRRLVAVLGGSPEGLRNFVLEMLSTPMGFPEGFRRVS